MGYLGCFLPLPSRPITRLYTNSKGVVPDFMRSSDIKGRSKAYGQKENDCIAAALSHKEDLKEDIAIGKSTDTPLSLKRFFKFYGYSTQPEAFF